MRRLSPQQLRVFHGLVRSRRVLDISDGRGPFLAGEFARYAKRWIVVGHAPPPEAIENLPPTVLVETHTFDAWRTRPPQDQIDVLVLTFPSPSHPQDAEALQWTDPRHQIVIFTPPGDSPPCGTPAFWDLAATLPVVRDDRDIWSRMRVLQRAAPEPETVEEEEEEEEGGHKHLPKRGQRFRLVANFRWPGKKPGERPPVVEITKTWERKTGSVKIVGTGEVMRIRSSDLGSPMA